MKKKSAAKSKPAKKAGKPTPVETPEVDDASTTEVATDADAQSTEQPADASPEEDLQTKYDRSSKQLERAKRANAKRHKLQNQVDICAQNVKSAQAALKKAIGARDIAVLELGRVLDDVKSGQQILPGTEECDDDDPVLSAAMESAAPAGETESWPIDTLGTKQLKAIVGADVFDAAKNIDDPIGLSDFQLDKLVQSEFNTIGELEKKMQEDSWWHNKVAKDPAAAIIQRVISSLLAFRKVHPKAELTPTVVDKLKEANEAAVPAESEAAKESTAA